MEFEPLKTCEDCAHFAGPGPTGEGTCAIDGSETWYGWSAPECENFVQNPKETEAGKK